MSETRAATYAVLAFGALMGLIALLLINYDPPAPTGERFTARDTSALLGRWRTRTVAEDDLNGAYNGFLEFGKNYYVISNDLVKQPVRIDNVRYALDGEAIKLWVEGSGADATRVTLLRHDRGRIQLPTANNLVLYMYRVE